jgi:hypothetical protein
VVEWPPDPPSIGVIVGNTTMQNDLAEIWRSFESTPFPDGIAGQDYAGICVTTVDTYAAGCIQSFVLSGALDDERVRALKSCTAELQTAIPHLPDSAKSYFETLHRLAVSVIEAVS